ncbi:hypothetical protein BEN47_06160 [Hymenobacter lapidarius]|uniref:Uncharacterized protein n=1 Tax=Hymenobacter lapidarius TaxID=1908237 RepID=A0A1G1SQF0_9BACT|nr:hypothetical protein [Hymenobacter lapidarius]OGX80838.1 hypothetical protein BEN47_06160 [Hymenobacter lapidarius]
MKNVMPGQAASTASPQTTTKQAQVTGLQALILELVLGSAYATQAEIDRTIASVAKCQNTSTLAKWYRNSVIELAEREERAPATYATGEQKQEIICLLNHAVVTRRHKTRVLLGINRLTKDAAALEITRLTAYIAAPFGGGEMASTAVELVGLSHAC